MSELGPSGPSCLLSDINAIILNSQKVDNLFSGLYENKSKEQVIHFLNIVCKVIQVNVYFLHENI